MGRPVKTIILCSLLAAVAPQASARTASQVELQRLRDQSSQVKQGMDQVQIIQSQRQQALAQLPILQGQAHDAQMLANQANKDYQKAQTGFQTISNKLNMITLHYIQTVQSMNWSQAGLEGQIPELSQMASSSNMHDTVLVYSQAETIMNHMQGQLDRMRDLAVSANQKKQAAETAQNNAQATQMAANQAMQQQNQLAAALQQSQSVLQAGVRSDQKALAQTFNQLLDSGVEMPSVDTSTISLPAQQRIVLLATREWQKGVRETPDGSNQSPDISRYLTATQGSVHGAAWCAYFVSYIARRAGVPIGSQGQGMGYVGSINDWAQSAHRYLSPYDQVNKPQGGDIIMWSPNHIGIVISRKGNDLTTIEGNASNAVSKLHRTVSGATGFLRLWGSPLGKTKAGGSSGGGTDLGNIS